ncbi:MAG: hypothetical protein JXQ29_16110 [Planctomycetes bacterium]|nr:hypothetical protein [Planctomycetota bacterium]
MQRAVGTWRARPGSGGPDGRRPSPARAGFTLIELLISCALFIGIVFVLYTFISGGVKMWRTGERRQDLYQRAQAAFEVLAADLWCTFCPQVFEEAPPVAQFLAERPSRPVRDAFGIESREPEERRPHVLGSRLRLVRTISGEFSDPVTRLSGLVAGATEHYLPGVLPATDDEEGEGRAPGESAPPAYKAPGGLMELMYLATVLPGSGQAAGMGTLLRGERMPVGGEGSFFSDEVADSPAAWTTVLRPVVGGVLHLGLEFWDQDTESWEGEPGEARSGVQDVWDSTRGRLKEFRFYRRGSAATDIDDIYPRRVRITLILSRPADAAMAARLAWGLGRNEKRLDLDRPGGLELEDEAVVLVGGRELMAIARAGAVRARIVTRGAYDTPIADHERGAPVVWGEVFTRVVNIPCYREYHNP